MDGMKGNQNSNDLDALGALQADAQELERLDNLLDRFNVFETIGFIKQEVIHSRFLAFLLDPKQNHGLGDVVLRKMLEKASATSNVASVLKAFEDIGRQNIEQTAVHTPNALSAYLCFLIPLGPTPSATFLLILP